MTMPDRRIVPPPRPLPPRVDLRDLIDDRDSVILAHRGQRYRLWLDGDGELRLAELPDEA